MSRNLIALIALSVAVVGCGGGDLKGKVVGTWKIDADSIVGGGLTPEMKKDPTMRKSIEATHLQFKADGTYSVTGTPMGADESGKWVLDGQNLTMTPSDPAKAKNQPKMTLNDDGSKIHAVATSEAGSTEMNLVKMG